MSTTAPNLSQPSGEARAAARRMRLFQLQRIVWELMFERYRGVDLREYFHHNESDALIAALRACSLHVDQIEFIGWIDPLVFRVDGTDGHEYIVGFDLGGPDLRLNAARVDSSRLTLPGEGIFDEHNSTTSLRGLPGFVEVAQLGDVTVDRAFLVGMSLVIGLMDLPDDDHDRRLMPLSQAITPGIDRLRAMAAGEQSAAGADLDADPADLY